MIMEKSEPQPLLRRHPTNPIFTSGDWPYAVNSVFNPGAVRLATGEIEDAIDRVGPSRCSPGCFLC